MAEPSTGLVRTYVELAHAIAQHAPDIIDAYYGPQAWAQVEALSLADLAAQADVLLERLAELEDEQRRVYLGGQVRAMRTTLGLLMGKDVPFREEVERLYDVTPEAVPEGRLAEYRASLAELVPGEGSAAERLERLGALECVSDDALRPVFDAILTELRRRTRKRFSLPDEEEVELRLVRDKPWGGYNTYQGTFTSRVEVNVDLPQRLHALPGLLAHEAYPGHHTEQAVKERALVGERGWLEHTLQLINTPASTVSEGIAETALDAVLARDELRAWLADELAPLATVPVDAALRMHDAAEILGGLERSVTTNAALMLFEQHAGDDEVLAYVQEQSLATRQEAEHTLRFLKAPRSGSYAFTYSAGRALLERLLGLGDPSMWFARLLTEPVTPAGIRAWIAAAGDPTRPAGAPGPARAARSPNAPRTATAGTPPAAASPVARPPARDLAPVLSDLEVELGGTLGVAAYALSGDGIVAETAVAYRAEEPFPAASTIKVFILQALLERVAAGEAGLAEELVLGSSDQVIGSGVLKALVAGRAYALRDLATLMIMISDNAATNMLIQRLGVRAVNDVASAHGWTATRLAGVLARPELRAPGDEAVATTSARDLADYFAGLWGGSLLPAELTRLAQGIFRRQVYTEQLGRYLPYDPDSAEQGEGPVIASKSGWIRGVRNDAGVVEAGDARYVLAIMTRDCPDRRVHLDNRGSLVVSKVSRLLYQRFVPR